MSLHLYNTLNRRKDLFRPLEKNKVRMYVCGPTVYDVPHIGHARSAYVFDIIRKYLERSGYSVHFVRNVTDIDDKIIDRAKSELEKEHIAPEAENLREKTREIAEKYLRCYMDNMSKLGLAEPTYQPLATENINGMIEAVSKLIEKKYAYASGGDVYFDVSSFKRYGTLSGRDKEDLLSGVRNEVSKKKKDPLDFALWKKAKNNEPSWPSPWGEGRPGWHIECAVMSTALLGACFDIHGGGLDLLFPHHENEMAQAEALTGRTFSRWWVHNGLLTVGGEKMSKSLGNYIMMTDFLKEYGDFDVLKISFLLTHYRKAIDCTEERFKEAARIKERMVIFLDKFRRMPFDNKFTEDPEKTGQFRDDIINAMDDDIKTPSVMKTLQDVVRRGNEILQDEVLSEEEKADAVGSYAFFIEKWAEFFSLDLKRAEFTEKEINYIGKLIQEREKARNEKDYTASDRIRNKLSEKGVVVEDTPEGPVWRKS